jgi:zinc transporter ZupT
MTDVIPCLYAAMLIGISTAVAAVIGFWAGRMREQLALLEILRPET